MAKQLNVSLAFTADTGKAKAQLKDLQNQLTQVMNLSTKSFGGEVMAQDIEKASLAAAQLKAHLEDATNVKTGKLDLGKLSESLDTKKLKAYRNSLQAIGVEGQKAFMMLAQSIAEAEVPLRRTSNLMTELWVTMKNTARWQFTSSAMHGFMSAVSSAYGYAQDLNESLNNIRIVSGASTEEMAKFALEANKAAKALSTTTTAYTNAALIYYQQGLSDEEIKKRSEITIKMANVTRESAEIVSDQLTAVWNNFYKEGEKGLQYYADVMTALGAATASSTDEIAGGLEKFASIADMIGLSFDYAATSLATITATTRQSEEVVGTALKTIFARIQGLKLGETLEDGTDLNKYSDSLKRVGIEIFDTMGELKDMDVILDEIGARWKSLAKSEQVALAQAVAGIRQYNQLVSLMDNWDYFQQNLSVAQNAEGALDEQAKIYEESWEAARDRVRAALESIYSDIIKDEAFIDMLNNIEKVITGIDHLIDSIGGLGGVLSTLGVIGTKVFHDQLTASLKNMAYSMDMTFGLGKERAQELQKTAWKETEGFELETGTFEGELKSDLIKEQARLQQTFIENSSKMSQEELKVNQILLDRSKVLAEIVGQRANEITKLEDAEKRERTNLELEIKRKKGNLSSEEIKSFTSDFKNTSRWSGRMLTGLSIEELEDEERQGLNYNELYEFFEKNSQGGVLNEASINIIKELFEDQAEDYIVSFGEISDAIFDKQLAAEEEFGYLSGLDDKKIQEIVRRNHEIAEGYIDVTRNSEEVKNSIEGISESFTKAQGVQRQFSDIVVTTANTIGSLYFSLNALNTAFEVLNNPDMSFMDKFLSISTSLLTIIPMLTTGVKGLHELINKETLIIIKNTAAQLINTLAVKANIAAIKEQGKAVDSTGKEIIKNTEIWTKQTASLIPKLLKVIGPYGFALGVIITAILGIIEAQGRWYANTPEGKLKTAKEAAEDAATAFEEVSTAVNEVKNSIDGLESSYDKINNFTKGTLEWQQAVSEVNAEVLKLIEQYPELAKYLQMDANGILSLPEEQLVELEKQLTNNLVSAQNTALAAQIEVQKAQQVVDRQDYNLKTEKPLFEELSWQTYTGQDMYGNAYEYQAMGYEYTPNEILQAAEQIYARPEIGEQLFTDSYLEAWAEQLGVNSEALKELIKSNQGLITEMSAMTNSIEAQDEVLLRNRISSFDSNMSTQEALEALEAETYSDYIDTFKDKVELTEEDYRKYTESIGAEFEKVKDGKIYYKKEGQEDSESVDIATLVGIEAEKQAESGLRNAITEQAKKNVASLGLKGDEGLSDESYIRLDNLKRNVADFGETLGWSEEETLSYQKAIQSSLKLDNKNTDEEKLNEKLASWENIEGSVENLRIIEAAVEELNQDLSNEEAVDKFNNTMNKLATQAELDDMTSSFKEAGKAFGLSDDESKEMQDYAKYLSEISEESDDLSDNLATDAEASADVAIQVTRMNKGVETLAEGFSDWNDVLRKSSKESKEYSDALNKTRSALSDVLGVEEDFIENDFVEEHLDDIKLAAEGNGDAIDRLKAALADDIILNITGKEKFEELETGLQTAITNMKSMLDNTELKIGDPGSAEFIAACQEIVNQAGMTAEEAQAYFSQMGFETKFRTEPQKIKQSVPVMVTETFDDGTYYEELENGTKIPYVRTRTRTYQDGVFETEGTMDAIAMTTGPDGETKVPQIESMTTTAPGSYNNYSPQNSGGPKAGGGGGSKVKPSKRSDVVDRYKEITDQLDDVQDAASDASKEMDRLYGANRLKAIDKQNALIQKEIGLLKQKRSEAEAYLEVDKQALLAEAQKAGVNLEIGADGNISNYTTVMNSLFDQLSAAEKAAGETADDYEQENIDNIQEKIDNLKSAIAQYDDTRELLQELENQMEDKFNEWQDNNYEKLTYSLELKLEINDMELERIDYFLSKFSDNFYKMAESAALMLGQIAPNKQSLEDNADFRNDLKADYEAGRISQADYIDGLKTVRENIYANLEALNEIDKTMLHYYEDTLAAANEELGDYTDHMEHLTGVFDHYLSLMNLLGRQKDYDAIGNFLGGKAETVRDRLNVAKEYYDMLLDQKDDVEAKLHAAIARGDDAAIELYKEEWDAIVDEVDAAQEQVLSLTEEWAEAMKAVIENNMTEIAETLEKTLTGGLNFDILMDDFDKLNTRQEEYLTKTNQIYETNKLMRTASKALDETDNNVAKQKLKNFIEETKSLQNNTKLSEYELEIQQAKYDLLLAEIALEEAQNAKSTVRLSRDNEGNFGYVFTADQDEIDNAQQDVEDADNRLYNLSLEGQQEYTEKYLQAQQELYNDLAELQQAYLDGDIASEEEYQRRKAEIMEHYFGAEGILTTYSNLYNVAVRTDADATADYWAKDYAQMTQNTEDWKIAVDQYLVDIEEQTQEWRNVSEEANRDVQNALNNSSKATKELTNESNKLVRELKNKVIPAIESELKWVAKQTEAYANQRKEILALIEAYERLAQQTQKDIEAASSYDPNKDYAFSAVDKALSGDYKGANEDIDTRGNKVLAQTGQEQDRSGLDNIVAWAKTLTGEQRTKAQKRMDVLETYGYGPDQVESEMMALGYDPNIKYYNTGGYTGAWGPEGKLAILHEKEIVLNANDTENLLQSVSFVRDLISMIDNQASLSNLGSLFSTPGVFTSDQTLEQQVSIHAEFPNATDRYEIEEAFNSLVNKASQYAHRK